LNFRRPARFYIGQRGPDFRIAELALEGGHIGFHRLSDDGGKAELGQFEQGQIVVVPGVTGRIVGRFGRIVLTELDLGMEYGRRNVLAGPTPTGKHER
jgi:hypothetical protein